jgi:hypothetical protein
MNRKTVLAISMVAVLTVAVAAPLSAEAILGLVQTEIKVKGDEITKLRFHGAGEIESDPFGGYAILTDADPVTAIAFTSHGGFYDSVVQGPGDNLDPPHVDFPGKAALCSTPTGCGPEWHVHIVEPVEDARCASGLAVGELTWDEPSETQKVAGENLIARNIPLGDNTYEAALGGGDKTFDAGTNIDTTQAGLAFPLTGIFTQTDPLDPTTLVGVCIGPLAPED